jgi:beta-lactamase class A
MMPALFSKSLLLRVILLITVTICLTGCAFFSKHKQASQPVKPSSLHGQMVALEAASHGRIGVYAINTANNTNLQYRATEPFPFCSTFKVMVVAAILQKSMSDPTLLQQKLTYTKKEIVGAGYAPLTSKHFAKGKKSASMTVAELCQAALLSDNVATNLLIKKLGGNQAVNAFARSIGDKSFRLDRNEPLLNSSIPGDLRDTTTPEAMAVSFQKIVLGNVLGVSQRKQLQTWLKANTTGDHRIRAGIPKGWAMGDKTGTSEDYGTTNDIAVIWPPKLSPIVLVVYFTQDKKTAQPRDAVIASATKMVMSEFAEKD